MANRGTQLRPWQWRDIAERVLLARGNHVPWKELETMFDLDRDSLARYAARLSREKLRQESEKLRHQDDGPEALAS